MQIYANPETSINLYKPDTRHAFAIIVPSTINRIVDGQKIVVTADDNTRQFAIDKILVEFSKEFGGASIIEQNGVWFDNDTGKLVYEKSSRIVTLVSEDLNPHNVGLLLSLALSVKRFFNQDAVLIEIDSKGWFV